MYVYSLNIYLSSSKYYFLHFYDSMGFFVFFTFDRFLTTFDTCTTLFTVIWHLITYIWHLSLQLTIKFGNCRHWQVTGDRTLTFSNIESYYYYLTTVTHLPFTSDAVTYTLDYALTRYCYDLGNWLNFLFTAWCLLYWTHDGCWRCSCFSLLLFTLWCLVYFLNAWLCALIDWLIDWLIDYTITRWHY